MAALKTESEETNVQSTSLAGTKLESRCQEGMEGMEGTNGSTDKRVDGLEDG